MQSPWELLSVRCAGANDVVIVAPYIKRDALAGVLDLLDPKAAIRCITRWTPLDIQTGVSDVSCRTLVVDRDGFFGLHNRLHAKYYRFDDQVLAGSANLTAAALSYSGLGNLEILCEPGAPFIPTVFEELLIEESREVSDEEFAVWQDCPVLGRPNASTGLNQGGITLDDWKPQTRNPEYLWLAYTGQKSEIVSEDQRTLATMDLEVLSVPIDLDGPAFGAWLRSSLQASPFVDSVRRLAGQSEALMWDAIAAEWGCSRPEAARWISTSEIWLRHFR